MSRTQTTAALLAAVAVTLTAFAAIAYWAAWMPVILASSRDNASRLPFLGTLIAAMVVLIARRSRRRGRVAPDSGRPTHSR